MKKFLVLFFILALSAPVFSEDAKIGFLDLQKALNESESGKRAKSELEDLIRKTNSRIEEKVAAKEKLRADLDRQRLVLSGDALRKKQDELERLEREIQRMIEDSQSEIQKRQREKEMAIFNDIDMIINSVGEEGGFSIILPADVILYSSGGVNITEQVIQRYNEAHKETKEETPKETPKETKEEQKKPKGSQAPAK